MNYLKSIVFVGVSILVSSCSLIGINLTYKTPKIPGKYPHFKEKDYLLGTNSELRQKVDVTFYDLNLDLDIPNQSIKGYVDIFFETLQEVDTLQLDLDKKMKINAIILAGDTIEYSRKESTVYVLFHQTIPKNQILQLRVLYEGKPLKAKRPPWDGGFIWEKDSNGNPWVSVACQGLGAHIWFPLKDHLSDEPDSVKLSMTVPKGLFCVSNGKLIHQFKNENTETFIWKTSYPINTYNITFYVGDYVRFSLPYTNKNFKKDMDFYTLSYDLSKGMTQFKQAAEVIAFYENHFGPYPWWNDGYKLVESSYLGMEHQTAIAYGNRFTNDYGSVDYIILHETGHEWWGNSLSISDNAEIWLHEGFTTFCDALFMEEKMGYDYYLDMMKFNYGITIRNKRPIIGPVGVNYSNFKDSDPYGKGALVLHTLRNIIDDDKLFFDILKTYYQKHQYSIVTTKDFINIVNEMTQKSYDWFFNQYLYSRVCPQLEWYSEYNFSTDETVLKYKWNNVGNEFKLPVVVETDYGKTIIYPTQEVQQQVFRRGIEIKINPNFSLFSNINKEMK